MATAAPKHILVSRTDKIGDLLLSLPVFQTLRKSFPQARITALVSPYAKEIVQGHPSIDAVETTDKNEGLFQLVGRLKKLQADTLVVLYPRPKIAVAAWLAGIPVRVGTAYRWYSFLFNHKVKVHRSLCDRHEVEYNLDLVAPLGVSPAKPKIQFPVSKEDREFARDLLKEKGLHPGSRYVAVHPGHKGSALNWSPRRYAEIIGRLCRQKGLKVVITAGPDETPLISQVTTHLHSLGVEQKPVLLIGECGLKQLAAVYEGAEVFLSGSTGTMHLAAAVGTPTIALFCPIPATTPVRWGPWGNRSVVLMPNNPDCADCRVGACQKHDPMDGLSVEDVEKAVKKFIRGTGSR